MFGNQDRDEARDRVVNETLDLIDKLDVDQARSLLRCFAIDEENFDSCALATVAKTVRATCHRSGSDYDALCHFPNSTVARLNREHLLQSLAVSAEAERVAQQAAEHAQGTSKPSQASDKVSSVEDTTVNGHDDQQQDGAAEFPTPDLGDLEFEKVETRRLFRDGHVTINHYHMNQRAESQPEDKPEPQPLRHLCAQCNRWYFEKDNVLQKDGMPPCGYHRGRIFYYGATKAEAWRKHGYLVKGRAWNCCRRSENAIGCNPAFHRPA